MMMMAAICAAADMTKGWGVRQVDDLEKCRRRRQEDIRFSTAVPLPKVHLRVVVVVCSSSIAARDLCFRSCCCTVDKQTFIMGKRKKLLLLALLLLLLSLHILRLRFSHYSGKIFIPPPPSGGGPRLRLITFSLLPPL